MATSNHALHQQMVFSFAMERDHAALAHSSEYFRPVFTSRFSLFQCIALCYEADGDNKTKYTTTRVAGDHIGELVGAWNL